MLEYRLLFQEKSTIGIELPNKVNSAVSFREILSKLPAPSDKTILAVGLGKRYYGYS